MTVDRRLEDALRATFEARAETITEGPLWDASVAASPRDAESGQGRRYISANATGGRARWRAPLLAAAAVVAVAAVTSVAVAGTRDRAATAGPATFRDGSGAGAPAPAHLTAPVASVDAAGNITVAVGSPATTLDVYEDAICPTCAEFEQANGPNLARRIDDGTLAVRYRMVDFLNAASASGTYSTRAYAAMLAVADHDGAAPGVFARFHAALFAAANQPREQATTDLSNAALAALAAEAGASTAAQQAITDGAAISTARAAAAANLKELTTIASRSGRAPGTPTVTVGETAIDTNRTGWLATVLRDAGGN